MQIAIKENKGIQSNMKSKISYREIAERTGISLKSVQNAHNKSGLVGEQLLDFVKNNVIGSISEETQPISVNGINKLELTGEETTSLKNAIILYNKMIDRLASEEMNHKTFIDYTSQIKKYTELIQNLKDKQGIVEGNISAIED